MTVIDLVMSATIPKALRFWFFVHFIADMIFAIPLLIAPLSTMSLFGWTIVDPLSSRLVGAALMGIGLESLFGIHNSLEGYRTMLRLKVIWSFSANVGIALSLAQGAPKAAWLFQGIFVMFFGIWSYYFFMLRKHRN